MKIGIVGKSRYIDAEKFEKDLVQACVHRAVVFNVLDRQPTADVVEVVRCKDCVYSTYYGKICHHGVGKDVSPDHYCSYGERREECKT